MCRVYQVPRLAYKCAGYCARINCYPPRAEHAARMQPRLRPFPPTRKSMLPRWKIDRVPPSQFAPHRRLICERSMRDLGKNIRVRTFERENSPVGNRTPRLRGFNECFASRGTVKLASLMKIIALESTRRDFNETRENYVRRALFAASKKYIYIYRRRKGWEGGKKERRKKTAEHDR